MFTSPGLTAWIYWDIEIPKIYTYTDLDLLAAYNRNDCFNAHIVSVSMNGTNYSSVVGHLATSYLPDGMPANSIAFANNAVLECGTDPVLRLPDGKKVEFQIIKASNDHKVFYPTKISDSFGNSINYQYITYNVENYLGKYGAKTVTLLKTISRSDGATVTFNHVDTDIFPKLGSIVYNNKTLITYHYGVETNPKELDIPLFDTVLDYVTDAVGRKTDYTWENVELDGKGDHDWYMVKQLKSVTLPEGAVITYKYDEMDEDITGQDPETNSDAPPSYNRAVVSKVISGDDIDDKSYAYSRTLYPLTYHVSINVGKPIDMMYTTEKTIEYDFIRVEETDTNAISGKHAIAGLPQDIKIYEGTTSGPLMYHKQYAWGYRVMGNSGCERIYANYTVRHLSGETYLKCGQSLLQNEIESLGSDTFSTTYSWFTAYGSPERIEADYVNADPLYKLETHYDDTTNWIVDLPEGAWVSKTEWPSMLINGPSNVQDAFSGWDATMVSKIVYWDKTPPYRSKPHYVYSEGGLLEKEYSEYYTSGSMGDIKRIDYRSKPGYELFENYKRGIAQLVTVPQRYEADADSMSYTVNDEGWITSDTDFNGAETRYSYDDIGRLTAINYVDQKWKDVAISYVNISGNLISSTNTMTKKYGAYTETTTYDELGRVKMIKTVPTSGQTTYKKFMYDINGKLKFESFPSASSNPTNGMTYTYDALGRLKQQENLETGTIRTWDYVAQNKIVYTDGRDNPTTTQYLRNGNDIYGAVKSIAAPESSTTTIDYDELMNPTTISQNGQTQTNIYDNYARLVSIVRSDVGTTTFGYFTDSRLLASETKGEGTTPVIYTYDNRGDLKKKNIEGGNTLLEQTLDPVGNIETMSSTGTKWSYLYNDRNLLEEETLEVDGQRYTLDWEYDVYGYISSVEYPNGEVVDFAPNGLGQAVQAGTYATNATYYPSGSLKDFTYGNGISRNIGVNAMGMITSIEDDSEVSVVSQHYVYDLEHNLEDMEDRVESTYGLSSLQYDGLNRLTGGYVNQEILDIGYNANNDITYKTVGDSVTDYTYDAATGLLSSTGGAVNRTFDYDVRGNVIDNGIKLFTFNEDNQMIEGAGITFTYDGFGNRVMKQNGTDKEYFMYSRNGRLMYKASDIAGNYTNYYYLGTRLVAKIVKESTEDVEHIIVEILISIDDLIDGNYSGNVEVAILSNGSTLWVDADSYIYTGVIDDLLLEGENAYELVEQHPMDCFYIE